MNKRGQIYILVALILALVLYMLMTKTNIIYEHEIIDDFETLSRNYDIEASRFMNNLLASDTVIINDFNTFTVDFTKYAQNQNPDFSLIYVFYYLDWVYIGNYLKNPIIVGVENPILIPPCLITTMTCSQGFCSVSESGSGERCAITIIPPLGDTLKITIGSNLYNIKINKDRPEIIIVSREEKAEQRKVYTKEEFVSGDPAKGAAVSGSEFYTKTVEREPYTAKGVFLVNKFNCEYFNDFKEACEFDENCCWIESGSIEKCVQGACST